ncbi:MAG: NAD(P)H-quinone oxidoreductase [Rhodospirillales bacterium]
MTLPASMRTVELAAAGPPENLRPGERPVPAPGPGELLVRVAYAGVNGPDLMQRKGLYPPPKGASDLLGLEIAGEVVSAGADVSGWAVGDKVCALTNGGGYAEYCVSDARHTLPVPQNWSLKDAASLPEAFFTVWSNVFMSPVSARARGRAHDNLCAGQVFLVHGAAGGLGTASIQLGKAVGATVIAVDGPAERLEICRSLGADAVIDYTCEDFVEVVRTAHGGADVILDIVGGENIARNIKAAKPDGRMIQLAFNRGSKVEIDLMAVMLKRLVYTGSTLRSRSGEDKAGIAASLRENVWPMIAAEKIRPVVNTVLPLADAAEAHALMEIAGHTGKIMLDAGAGGN